MLIITIHYQMLRDVVACHFRSYVVNGVILLGVIFLPGLNFLVFKTKADILCTFL